MMSTVLYLSYTFNLIKKKIKPQVIINLNIRFYSFLSKWSYSSKLICFTHNSHMQNSHL